MYFGWVGADENKRACWLVAAPEYLQPLQLEASTVQRDKEKVPSLWLLPQEGKRRLECVCPTVQLSGDFLKNWFLSHLTQSANRTGIFWMLRGQRG